MIYLGNSLVILTVNMHMHLLCEFVCSTAFVWVFKCICLDVQVHMFGCSSGCVWMFKCMCLDVQVHIFGCSSAYVCMFKCICICLDVQVLIYAIIL